MVTISTGTNKKQDKVSRIIDRVLTQIFGKEATLLIYRYLEENYSLKQNEVSEKIDLFAEGLETFLSSGALAIEKRILEDIYSSYKHKQRILLVHEEEIYSIEKLSYLPITSCSATRFRSP